MGFACRITKETIQTHRKNITFPQQLWLHDRALNVTFTYIACLVWRCFQQPWLYGIQSCDD